MNPQNPHTCLLALPPWARGRLPQRLLARAPLAGAQSGTRAGSVAQIPALLFPVNCAPKSWPGPGVVAAALALGSSVHAAEVNAAGPPGHSQRRPSTQRRPPFAAAAVNAAGPPGHSHRLAAASLCMTRLAWARAPPGRTVPARYYCLEHLDSMISEVT